MKITIYNNNYLIRTDSGIIIAVAVNRSNKILSIFNLIEGGKL